MTIRHSLYTIEVEQGLKPGDILCHEHGRRFSYDGCCPDTGTHFGVCLTTEERRAIRNLPVWTKEPAK